ncbi:MAG: hypothetical protein LBE10_06165 [Treponema sp.]|jgi:hypothetical protein|nr:hypothetical protein [Treponema sp.]
MEIRKIRDSLIKDIESELEKGSDAIDPGFIDRRVDELYLLDGLSPPKLNDEALAAVTRSIRIRAAWRRRNRLADEARKRRFAHRAVRGAMAACFAVLFFFSVNYVSVLVTGSCLPSKVGIKICCGTKFCLCDIDKAKKHPILNKKNATFYDSFE